MPDLIDRAALRDALRLYTYDGATLPTESVEALIDAAPPVSCEWCVDWDACGTEPDGVCGAFERRQP